MKKIILFFNLFAVLTLVSCASEEKSSIAKSNSSVTDSSSTASSKTNSSNSVQTVDEFTITFENYDGKILQNSKYKQGVLPAYRGVLPTKPADVQYSYAFNGWDKEITVATADTTYTAIYSNQLNQYNVTFKNCDGIILQTSSWDYGSTPSYDGATPVKEGDAQYSSYSFAGWDKDIVPVATNIVYVATYKGEGLKEYTITFVNYDGTALQTSKWDYGTTPVYDGLTPAKSGDAQYASYSFNGWTPVVSSVICEATYTAQFSNGDLRKYSITFKNYDGAILEEKELDFGTTPVYSGATPTKPADKLCTHPFAGWSPNLSLVKENAIYTACFSNVNLAKIVWGKYPQTIVEDATLLTALSNAQDANGDGFLEYGNDEYYKLAGASVSASSSYPIKSETGKTTFINGSTYYFKVEPIEWSVLDSSSGLLMAKKILFRSDYYTASSFMTTRTIDSSNIENNNYRYSTLRAKLNGLDFSANMDSKGKPGVNFSGNTPGVFSEAGGFLNNAFSIQEQQEIQTSEVDNSAASTINPNNTYACANTYDKVFALSYQDLSNANYGFDSTSALEAIVTDYARATGVYASMSEYWLGEGSYWTRSPYAGKYYSDIVSYVDYLPFLSDLGSDDDDVGVRPAIKMVLD
jgi:hypothetical protein